jgi:hypothetical protein
MRVTVAVVMRGACGVPCAQERASLPIGFGLGGVVGCLNALVGSSRRRRRPKSEANARRRTTPRPSPQPLGWWLAWGPALGPGAAGRVRWARSHSSVVASGRPGTTGSAATGAKWTCCAQRASWTTEGLRGRSAARSGITYERTRRSQRVQFFLRPAGSASRERHHAATWVSVAVGVSPAPLCSMCGAHHVIPTLEPKNGPSWRAEYTLRRCKHRTERELIR